MAKAQQPSAILLFEHVNINVQSWTPEDEKLFYGALGCVRDARTDAVFDRVQMRGGSRKGLQWVNFGLQQFHMPLGEQQNSNQCIRGTVGLAFPSLEAVRQRLCEHEVEFKEEPDGGMKCGWPGPALSLQTPSGQPLRLHSSSARFAPPGAAEAGLLSLPGGPTLSTGMPYLELLCAPGTAAGIGRFYTQMLGALSKVEDGICKVFMGNQAFIFHETPSPDLPPYDGHHVAIYIGNPENGASSASYAEMYMRCKKAGLVHNNPRFPHTHIHSLEDALRLGEFRVLDLVDPDTGTVVYTLEHEIRSLEHPGFSCKALVKSAM